MASHTFPKFRNLPKELRDNIWDLAIREAKEREPAGIQRDRVYLTAKNESAYGYLIFVARSVHSDNEYWPNGIFWNVCQESRDAVRRKWRIVEDGYASFRHEAERSTLLREMHPVWIPGTKADSNVAACSRNLNVQMVQRKFTYDPSVPHDEQTRALERVISGVTSHPELQDIPSWCAINTLFFRGHLEDEIISYGLSRAVALDDYDFAFDAYTWPASRSLRRSESGPRRSPDFVFRRAPYRAAMGIPPRKPMTGVCVLRRP
jgi:hypothetical protein